MRPSRNHRTFRTARFEIMEPRLVMTSQPVPDFTLEYMVEDQMFEQVNQMLSDAHALSGLDTARDAYGFTGQGQTVVVIDSGIAYDHQALGGGLGAGYKVVGGYDFTEERDANPYDDGSAGGHGTHVAGIIGGDSIFAPGVAPGVDLVALRVFNDSGAGYFNWIEDALSWVHDNRNAFANPITTVNLSIGAAYNGNSVPAGAMLEDEFAQLAADGMFISVAAGNSFTTYNSPGLAYPAVSPHVVPVASVDDGGDMSYFSQRNSRVIAAPGRSVQSTIPDYAGNRDGIGNDYAKFSGTSMAAPYVAGAAALLREAYAFVGQASVTQSQLYDLMYDTADVFYDSATNADYHRLNIAEALDAVMPVDDVGNTLYMARDLGSVDATWSFDGTMGRLDDVDYFKITATESGQLTLSVDTTHDMTVDWADASQYGGTVDAQGNLVLNVVAGESYKIGLGTSGGLGYYTLDAATTAVEPEAVVVGQAVYAGNQVDSEGLWFSFTASQTGLFTAEALFSHAGGDVDLEVYDANMDQLAAGQSVSDNERIDLAVNAGDTLNVRVWNYAAGTENLDVDLRVTNLVSQSGSVVNISGTDAADTFTFAAGSTHQATINGVVYEFDSADATQFNFDGLAGSDTANLIGSSADETVVLRYGSATMTGSGYGVSASNTETLVAEGGGGNDSASVFDTASDSTLNADATAVTLSTSGYSQQVSDFGSARIYTAPGRRHALLSSNVGSHAVIVSCGKPLGESLSVVASQTPAEEAQAESARVEAPYIHAGSSVVSRDVTTHLPVAALPDSGLPQSVPASVVSSQALQSPLSRTFSRTFTTRDENLRTRESFAAHDEAILKHRSQDSEHNALASLDLAVDLLQVAIDDSTDSMWLESDFVKEGKSEHETVDHLIGLFDIWS